MNKAEVKLEDGYLIVLPRDEAKAFFGYREDEARLQFIHELLGNEEVGRLHCNGKWLALQAAFEQVNFDDSLLAQCLLGGRAMHQGDDYHVCLVRPDIVGYITKQADTNSAVIQASSFGDLKDLAESVLGFYEQAAKLRGAMVFVAKK